MNISLVTYTHNDHAKVDSLLAYVRSFGVPFFEIIIVDDGSDSAYSLEGKKIVSARVLRNSSCAGPGQAKRKGLEEASGDLVLSLDADIRPHANWLKHSMSLLGGEDAGMVGSLIVQGRSANSLGLALHRSGFKKGPDKDVLFLAAGCMLFFKSTWNKTGGLKDYHDKSFEDYYLSRKMREHSLRLICNNSFPVYETRELHRTTYCRRFALYETQSIAAIIHKFGLERYLHDIQTAFEGALASYAKHKDPVLVYVFFLKTAYLIWKSADEQARAGKEFPFLAKDVIGNLLKALNPYPQTQKLLKRDLLALQVELPDTGSSFSPLQSFVKQAEKNLLFPGLEEKWIAKYQTEDSSAVFDRHYSEDVTP